MPSPTTSPSICWNIGLCVRSGLSRRNTRPGAMIRIGGRCVSMCRICIDEVCVRSSVAGRAAGGGRSSARPGRGTQDWTSGARQVQRVLHVARRVLGRDVERLEVVVVVLGLGAVDNLVAHAQEDRLDLLAHDGQRMPAADDDRPAGAA